MSAGQPVGLLLYDPEPGLQQQLGVLVLLLIDSHPTQLHLEENSVTVHLHVMIMIEESVLLQLRPHPLLQDVDDDGLGHCSVSGWLRPCRVH